MQRYLIERPKTVGDSGVYFQGSHYYIYLYIRDIMEPNAKSNPSDVQITITNPCGTDIVTDDTMSNITTGEYSYDTDLSSSAYYGKYTVKISTITHKSTSYFDFYVLPWNAVPEIRRLSGIEEWKSISDEDIAIIFWNCFTEVRNLVFNKHHDVKPRVDPDTGRWFDGTTTEFRTKHRYLADYDLDGSYTQTDTSCHIACQGDIDGWWLDDNYERQALVVTIDDAEEGKIHLYQSDGVTAIPRTQCGVFLTYWTEYHTYNSMNFKEAVEYLSAHKIAQRFHETDRATLVDIQTNKTIFVTDPNRLSQLYKEALSRIREPLCGGAS